MDPTCQTNTNPDLGRLNYLRWVTSSAEPNLTLNGLRPQYTTGTVMAVILEVIHSHACTVAIQAF
jgi:hypothetical protein